jgi:hypothetical protein
MSKMETTMKERIRLFLRQRFFFLITLAALVPHSLLAQSGTLGSTSSPVVNAFGRPMGGVDISICQPLAATAAQVISNTALLTMASNPITAGFAAGMQVQVSGFSGADTYFNGGTFTNGTGITGGYTILSVTSTTITYSLTHANATASSNGAVLQQGNTTTACAGLSGVYSDPGMTQPIAQPVVTDGYGNWNAFAQSGQLYYVQFYGSGVTTSMRWIMVNVATNAAVKPQPSDAVQYVSPNGNDGNDGLSLGSAKLTWLGAWNALPAGGGTIHVSGGNAGGTQVYCTPAGNQGFGIAGALDPNYASMPVAIANTYWVKAKTGPVNIQGISAATFGAASSTAWMTTVHCGNSSTPALWLSDVGNGFTITFINLPDGSIAIRDGIDSNGNRGATSGASSTQEFGHLQLNSVSGGGPTFDGGALLNVALHDISASNNSGQAATSNAASNFYFSTGGTGPFLGLVVMDNIEMNGGGGIRYDANTGVSGSVYVRRMFMQGSGVSQPAFEVVNSGGLNAAHITLDGGESDSGTNIPIIRVNAANDPCTVTVDGVNQHNYPVILEGPMTIGGGTCNTSNAGGTPTYAENTPLPSVIPAAKYQRNGMYGLTQAADSYRRSFSPSFVRFANLAAQNPASWTTGEGAGETLTLIQGPGDPSGATNAATENCTANGANGGCDYIVYSNSLTLNAGDYLYFGAWAQPASPAGFATCGDQFGCPLGVEMSSNPVTIRVMAGGPAVVGSIGNNGMTTCAFTCIFGQGYNQTDGNWQYVWAVAKVLTPAAGATTLKMHLSFKAGFPVNVYAPMFVRVLSSSVALTAAPTFSSASETGNTVTFTTTTAHNLYGGMPIVISGCSVAGYNTVVGSDDVVTGTPSATTFTLYNPASGLGAPTGCVITPGNDSEVADWANNFAPYGDNCATGTLCGIRGVTVPKIVASGTSTLSNSSIGAGACATVVTSAATGVATTDRLQWAYASAPATADGLLTLNPYVTSGNVNWKLCNPTASSQTPSGLVVNWSVLR